MTTPKLAVLSGPTPGKPRRDSMNRTGRTAFTIGHQSHTHHLEAKEL